MVPWRFLSFPLCQRLIAGSNNGSTINTHNTITNILLISVFFDFFINRCEDTRDFSRKRNRTGIERTFLPATPASLPPFCLFYDCVIPLRNIVLHGLSRSERILSQPLWFQFLDYAYAFPYRQTGCPHGFSSRRTVVHIAVVLQGLNTPGTSPSSQGCLTGCRRVRGLWSTPECLISCWTAAMVS